MPTGGKGAGRVRGEFGSSIGENAHESLPFACEAVVAGQHMTYGRFGSAAAYRLEDPNNSFCSEADSQESRLNYRLRPGADGQSKTKTAPTVVLITTATNLLMVGYIICPWLRAVSDNTA